MPIRHGGGGSRGERLRDWWVQCRWLGQLWEAWPDSCGGSEQLPWPPSPGAAAGGAAAGAACRLELRERVCHALMVCPAYASSSSETLLWKHESKADASTCACMQTEHFACISFTLKGLYCRGDLRIMMHSDSGAIHVLLACAYARHVHARLHNGKTMGRGISLQTGCCMEGWQPDLRHSQLPASCPLLRQALPCSCLRLQPIRLPLQGTRMY